MTTAEEQAQRAIEGDVGSRVLDRIISQVGGRAGAKAVFGDPVERDGATVITVARVRWGFGGGGGGSPEGSDSGGGGGVGADPIGYIEVTSAGATFRPVPRSIGAAEVLGGAIATAIVLRALALFRR